MLTFTTTLKERAPVSKQGYYHQRIPTEKFRFIGIKIYNLTERINQEGASAPCRYANEKMAPLKEELKDREIVYIYIASESSPKET